MQVEFFNLFETLYGTNVKRDRKFLEFSAINVSSSKRDNRMILNFVIVLPKI